MIVPGTLGNMSPATWLLAALLVLTFTWTHWAEHGWKLQLPGSSLNAQEAGDGDAFDDDLDPEMSWKARHRHHLAQRERRRRRKQPARHKRRSHDNDDADDAWCRRRGVQTSPPPTKGNNTTNNHFAEAG